MYQEKDELKCDQISETEILELTESEALGVAGGPEPDHDPRKGN